VCENMMLGEGQLNRAESAVLFYTSRRILVFTRQET
jgi:hypothetical protein